MGETRIDAHKLQEARRLYETSWLVPRAIATKTDVSARSIARIAAAQGWSRPAPSQRRHFATRLWQTAERLLIALEDRGEAPANLTAVRDLATLTKTLRDLVALETEEAALRVDDVAVDFAEFKDELRQRLVRLHHTDSPLTQVPPAPVA